MLYSPDWVYALVLFLAHGFKRFSDHKWLQLILLLFVVLMMIENLNLIEQIITISAPIPQG
jgi:hypothetical protein